MKETRYKLRARGRYAEVHKKKYGGHNCYLPAIPQRLQILH